MALRIGMVGGGQGAFIGAVHRMALALDRRFELVAGCFSANPKNCAATGRELGLAPGRVYVTYEEMAEKEAALPETERIDAVAIVTPNHLHHGPAILFLQKGIHVVCEKPLTTDVVKAEEIAAAVRTSGKEFVLTHNYTGYPMVREARERIALGELGDIRKVYVEYLQGWLSEPLERTGQKQADWRTDPERSGPVGALGDIGTHAFNLLEHVTGLCVTSLFAVLRTFVEGRKLDDDDMVLLELGNGASGSLCCSQVAWGRENGLALRVFGTRGALSWEQEHPEDLRVVDETGATRILRPNTEALTPSGKARSRIPAGHPEGYIEGFANLYRSFANAIEGQADLSDPYPTVEDGVREMRFVEACLESSRTRIWVKTD